MSALTIPFTFTFTFMFAAFSRHCYTEQLTKELAVTIKIYPCASSLGQEVKHHQAKTLMEKVRKHERKDTRQEIFLNKNFNASM